MKADLMLKVLTTIKYKCYGMRFISDFRKNYFVILV